MCLFNIVFNIVLNMKALVGAFDLEKVQVGIVKL